MGTYTSEAKVEAELQTSIDDTTNPTSTQLATFITEAEEELTYAYDVSVSGISNLLSRLATKLVAMRVLEAKAAAEGLNVDLIEGPYAGKIQGLKEDVEHLRRLLPPKSPRWIRVDRLEEDECGCG